MNKFSQLLVFLIILLPTTVISQNQINNDSLQSLEIRVEVLESHRENIDQKIENESKALDLKAERIKQELNADHRLVNILALIFGPLTFVGLVGLLIAGVKKYFKLLSKTEEIAQRKVDEKLDEHFTKEKERLKELVSLYDEENQLKNESEILVLSPTSNEADFMKRFFQSMGFKNVEFNELNSVSISEKDVDMLFINDESDHFDEKNITSLQSSIPNDMIYFYFGKKRFDLKKESFASATFRSQLYGNLINALRYQQLL